MVEKDPIDNLIRNKMQERSFSPGPNDWRDMETLLNRHMPVQRKKYWLRIPILFSIASAAFIWWQASTPVAQPPVTSSQVTHAENTTSLPAAAPETDATTNAAYSTTEQNVTPAEQTPAPVTAPSSAQPAQPLPNKSNSKNINATTEKSVAAKTSAAGTPSVKPILPLYSKTEVTTKNPPAPEKENMRGPSAKPNHQSPPPTAAAPSLTTPSPSPSLPVVSPASDKETSKQPDTETAAPIKKETETIAANTTGSDHVTLPPLNPMANQQMADSNIIPKDSTASENVNAGQDSSTNLSKQPKGSANPDKKFSLALSAGVQGWGTFKQANDTFSTYRFSNILPAFALGLQGTYRFNPNWSLGLGAQYSVHTNLTEEEKKYEVRDYSFGRTQTNLTVSTSKLMYLHTPLEIQYHINKRHTLLTSVHMDWLLNSSNTLQFVITSLPSANPIDTLLPKTLYVKKKGNGYHTGYRPASWSLALGYGLTLGNRWFLSAKVQYGLTDNSINTYFGNREAYRNTAVQFIVRYNIIHF